MFDNNEKKTFYKKSIFSKKNNKKRKRNSTHFIIFFEFRFQQQQNFQISIESIIFEQSKTQINQFSISKLTIHLRILHCLYEKHSNVEFFYTFRDICEKLIDHFNESKFNIESYIYCSLSFKSTKSSSTNSISIFNTFDSFDFFRLTTRTSLQFSKSQFSSDQSCHKTISKKFKTSSKTTHSLRSQRQRRLFSRYRQSFSSIWKLLSKSATFQIFSNEIEKSNRFFAEIVFESMQRRHTHSTMRTTNYAVSLFD